MTTPFDGKLNWWHYRADTASSTSPTWIALEMKRRTPAAAGIIVKVAHGHTWEGPKNSIHPLAIHGPDDVARWASRLAAHSLDLHIWATPVGADPQREAMIVAQAANAPGVKSVILDVEPYDGFWQGDAAAAERYMTTLVCSVSHDLHIGMSVDSRNVGKLRAIHFDTWKASGIDSLHPQVYWHDFGLPFGIALHECTETLAGTGLPIYPVLGTYPNPRTGVAVPPEQLTAALVATKQALGAAVAIPAGRRQLDGRHLRRYQQGMGGRMKTAKRKSITLRPGDVVRIGELGPAEWMTLLHDGQTRRLQTESIPMDAPDYIISRSCDGTVTTIEYWQEDDSDEDGDA